MAKHCSTGHKVLLAIAVVVLLAFLGTGVFLYIHNKEPLPPLPAMNQWQRCQNCSCKAPWARSKDFGDGNCQIPAENYSIKTSTNPGCDAISQAQCTVKARQGGCDDKHCCSCDDYESEGCVPRSCAASACRSGGCASSSENYNKSCDNPDCKCQNCECGENCQCGK